MKAFFSAASAGWLAALLLAPAAPAAAQAPAWQSARTVAAATAAATTNSSEVRATAVDAAGNVYLAGSFENSVALGGTTLTSVGDADVFVAKFSPASNQFVWAQRVGGTGQDFAYALAVSGTGVYVAGGFRSSTADFGPTTLTNAGPGGSDDVFVAKLTDAGSSGSFAWAQRAGGTDNDGALALAVSGTSVYMAGYFFGPTADFGSTNLTNAGVADVFVAKLTDAGPTGGFVWAQRAGGTGGDGAAALAVWGTAVFVAGGFASPTADFGSTNLTNAGAGYSDVFVAKLTDAGPTGSFAWAQRAGGTGDDRADALAVGGTGVYSVYAAGYVESPTAGFGPIVLTNPTPGTPLGFLASLTDPTLTATTAAAGPREPAALFPNPARHAATLRLPAGVAPAPLVLADARGRVVRRYPAPAGGAAVLDLSGLPAGLYLLRGAGPARRLAVE